MTRFRFPILPAPRTCSFRRILASVGASAVLGCATSAMAFGPYAKGDLPADEIGPHGAMAMDEQQQRLDDILADRDLGEVPDWIDAEIWELVIPDDNEMTQARVDLGRRLYFEKRLSADDTVSCATCHDVSRGFTDQRPTSEGIRGQLGQRNAPTTANAMFYTTLFLDGRTASLEEQARFPPINPVEGGLPDHQAVVAAVADDESYREAFQAAYGSEPNMDDLVRAIAAFERTLVFLDSPFDRFLAGDEDAISEQAKRGWDLYNGKARCVSCHMLNPSNPLGTDHRFHNIGVAARAQDFEKLAAKALEVLEQSENEDQAIDELALATDLSELGRFMVTKDYGDIGAFKTQGVRNVGVTAPYMHDGSMRTLWDVMDHYNKGGEPNPYLDGGIEPLALSEDEIDAVVAFMFSLTDDAFAEQNESERQTQREIAADRRPFRDEDVAQRRVLLFERRVMGTDSDGDKEQE